MMNIEKKIWSFWTARNPMSPNRTKCLESMKTNWDVPIELVDWKSLPKYILKDYPLHSGFKYLSCNHRSDYLRCYFMHFYGGGYADIKHSISAQNWNLCFDIITQFPQIEVIGMPEVIHGAARPEWDTHQVSYKLLANGWFICRAQTEFTHEWYRRLNKRMDSYLPLLRAHPATDPFGEKDYPIPWVALQGDIFHELILETREKRPLSLCSALQPGVLVKKNYR